MASFTLAHKLPLVTLTLHGAIAVFISLFFSLMDVGLHPDNTDRINSFLHQITEGVYCKNICTEYVIYKIVYPFVKPLYFHVYITPTYSLLILYHNAVYHD